VLDQLAQESKLTVTDAEVERRMQDLEQRMKAAGEAGGLKELVRKKGMSLDTFREFRGALDRAGGARAPGLGIPAGRTVPGDQQEMWLDQVMQSHGVDIKAANWDDGVVARCGDVRITVPSSPSTCASRSRARSCARTASSSCSRSACAPACRTSRPRRSRAPSTGSSRAARPSTRPTPSTRACPTSRSSVATGLDPQFLRRDPAVVIAALAQLWIERTWGADGLKQAYQAERAHFDGRYGDAFEVNVLFLRAAVFQNQLNPRTFDEAEKQLGLLRPQIKSKADFQRLASLQSEEPVSRARQGLVGWVAREDERVGPELAAEVFRRGGSGELRDQDRLIGPVRMQNGVALAWIGDRRSSIPWDEMAQRVQRELKKRLLDEALLETEVATFLDANRC
jgi:hypothetical protein